MYSNGVRQVVASCFLFPAIVFININAMAQPQTAAAGNKIKLIILDPGHFHAALVQKYKSANVSDTVMVYAPPGEGVEDYLALIDKYNTRTVDPTSWKEIVYTGKDYFEKMLAEKTGNVVVIAGNNKLKAAYIEKSLKAGLHVLADKPLAITAEDFSTLKNAFQYAEENGLLLYDIMTERFNVLNIILRNLVADKAVFGLPLKGNENEPAISISSVHHFYKEVSGSPLRRPTWFFDIHQQGDGMVDVSTHLVDIIQWLYFPGTGIDLKKDIHIQSAKRWATEIDREQFKKVTRAGAYPAFLNDAVTDGILHVYSNSSISYSIKGFSAKVAEEWNFEAPAGTGDLYHLLAKGTKASLAVEQGKEQGYVPALYIIPVGNESAWEENLKLTFIKLGKIFPGIDLQLEKGRWKVVVPPAYITGHEAQFSMVAEQFFNYLQKGKLPSWEISFMLAKYFTTTASLAKALKEEKRK